MLASCCCSWMNPPKTCQTDRTNFPVVVMLVFLVWPEVVISPALILMAITFASTPSFDVALLFWGKTNCMNVPSHRFPFHSPKFLVLFSSFSRPTPAPHFLLLLTWLNPGVLLIVVVKSEFYRTASCLFFGANIPVAMIVNSDFIFIIQLIRLIELSCCRRYTCLTVHVK